MHQTTGASSASFERINAARAHIHTYTSVVTWFIGMKQFHGTLRSAFLCSLLLLLQFPHALYGLGERARALE